MLEQYKLQYAEYLESLPEDKRQEELQNNQPKKKRSVKPKNASSTPPKPAKTGKQKKQTAVAQNKADNKTTQPQMQLFDGEPEQPPA